MPSYYVNRNIILPEASEERTFAVRGSGVATAGQMVFIQAPGEIIPLGEEVRLLAPSIWSHHLERLLANGDLLEVGNPEPAVGIVPGGDLAPGDDIALQGPGPEAGGLVIGNPGDRISDGSIRFSVAGGLEVLRFDPDGKIYVQGRLVEEDSEVMSAFRWFLQQVGLSDGHSGAKPLGPLLGYKVPRYALGQKVWWADGAAMVLVRGQGHQDSRSGVIVAAYKDLDTVREIHFGTTYGSGHNFEENQVIYHVLRDDMALCLVPESVVTPVVPKNTPREERPTVWDRLGEHE